ncbi:conjugal transfer protein [Streptomyces venezuelae]|uniref:conjugal transfer protein n=1 Tax=Streptomyces venezuelae TaxID=54571 RepID=UPI0012389F7D|nr:conjugal transfer protein [Streptomyces venezuelae]QES06819.1 conjugal transfer protein [Streptomyces venezuelae]
MTVTGKPLSRAQKVVLGAAFVPMLGTGVAGGVGTYSNISTMFGSGTAVGAVAAGEGATAVLAIVLLGLTMLGQSSPRVIRAGLWALPAAASAMSATAAKTPGEMVIYALTPMGMTASAEGAAFLARRIVVYRDGRDAEAEAHAAGVVQALAFHQAMAANHPDVKVRKRAEEKSWKLARKVGVGDLALGDRLLDVQRQRVTAGADAALAAMFGATTVAPNMTAGTAAPVVELEVDRPTRPIHSANAEESTQSLTERSTPDLHVPALDPAPVAPAPSEQEELTPRGSGTAVEEATSRAAVRAVAAEQPVRRRATGRVPQVARSVQPRRTKDELLSEARQVTESWPVEQLTADGIRKAVRTSPEKGRWLRDTLKGERGEAA